MLRNTHRHGLLAAVVFASFLGCDVQKGPEQPIKVAVRPDQVDVPPATKVPFAATVTGTADTSVLWGVQEGQGGTITALGLYTAPASQGTFHVTATSNADPTKQGMATVTVTPPPITIVVSPAQGSANACQTLQFTATVSNATDTSVTWSVQEGPVGGGITAGGLYTAPTDPGVYHVVAVSVADPTKSFVSSVTVTESVLSVVVTPNQITLTPGGTSQFTATVTNTCGTFAATRTVTASAKGTVSVK